MKPQHLKLSIFISLLPILGYNLEAQTTTLVTTADTFVRSPNSDDTNYGSSTGLAVGNNLQNQKDKNNIAFTKFDLSSITGTITGATYKLDYDSTFGADINVFGIVDTLGDEDFNESTLTFNTSSHTTTDNTGTYANNGSLDETNLTYLGTFSTGTTAGVLSFSSASLVDFLNADTNNIATLVFHSESTGGAQSSSFFASKEHSTRQAPQLVVVVPEPGTYALIAGLLGLTSVMLRRRN